MNQYLLTLVFKNDLNEKDRKVLTDDVLKRVLGTSGKVEKEEPWGSKDLAYPILHNAKGYYLHMQLTTDPANIKGIDKYLNTEEEILRYLLVRV